MPLPFNPDFSIRPDIIGFFDEGSNTISYIVRDPTSTSCAVIDAVMEFDYSAGRLTFDGADRIIQRIRDEDWTLEWLIETHIHADHLSGAPYIQEKLGGRIGIGEQVTEVQETFGKIFNEGTEFERDGSAVRPPVRPKVRPTEIGAHEGPSSCTRPATHPPA